MLAISCRVKIKTVRYLDEIPFRSVIILYVRSHWLFRTAVVVVWMQLTLYIIKIWCGLTRAVLNNVLLDLLRWSVCSCNYKHGLETCVPFEPYRGCITSSSSRCRWTDEHGGEEEEEAAQEQNHLQQQPAPGSGESVWEDTLPRRLRQRGPGPPGQPHRGQSPGMNRDISFKPRGSLEWFSHTLLPYKIKSGLLKVWRFSTSSSDLSDKEKEP